MVKLKNDYLISVAIPTHNRSKYAIDCVKSLLRIDSDKLQVIVHDTSDDSLELKCWAENITDKRLNYIHSSKRLSMTENHEVAISYAAGLYTILIGDDDSVSSTVIDLARYALSNNIDILVPKVKAVYSWPDFKTKFYGGAHAGKLYLDKYDSRISIKDSSLALSHMLKNACQGTDGMPKLYHGMVRTSLLRDLKIKNDMVFFGVSPDVSASISLALVVDKFYEIDFPFTLPGASGGSNTGRSALNKHRGDLESDEHIKPFLNLNWPDTIPKFFSVETVWSQAAWSTIYSQKNAESHLFLERFNLNQLYALCLLKHRHYSKLTWRAFKNAKTQGLKVSRLSIVYNYAISVLEIIVRKSKRLLNPLPSGGKEVLGTFETVYEAIIELDKTLLKDFHLK